LPAENQIGTTVTATVVVAAAAAAATTNNHKFLQKSFAGNAVQQRTPGLRQAKQALSIEKFLVNHFIANQHWLLPVHRHYLKRALAA